MRKVTAGLFISLDGVVEAPNVWQFDAFDDDMEALMADMLSAQDTVLLGRVTYQEWAAFWPTATIEPFASYINSIPKYVASTTLKTVEWRNSTLLDGALVDAVSRLKQQPGRAIGVAGSPTLVRSLLHAGLLDELTLTIHPVIAGTGMRLFQDGAALQRLEVIASKTSRKGVLMVTYRPRPAE